MAYGARARGQRRLHRSQRTGKPSPRAQRQGKKKPTGEGKQVSHGKDVKGRERRTAETILNSIQDQGTRQLPLDDVYRQLSNPDLYLRTYATLSTNDGALTPGITEETVDGWSWAKVAKIIEAIRDERWQWPPVKRILIDKPTGGKRPLGLPVWSDKVVQDHRKLHAGSRR